MFWILKFLIFATILLAVFLTGYKVYIFLNNKIMSADSGWGILGYILLLIVSNCILFFGGLYALIALYGFLLSTN